MLSLAFALVIGGIDLPGGSPDIVINIRSIFELSMTIQRRCCFSVQVVSLMRTYIQTKSVIDSMAENFASLVIPYLDKR